MKIAQYQIVSAKFASDLQSQVQDLVSKGWQPVGPATYIPAAASAPFDPRIRMPPLQAGMNDIQFIQTMVQYTE